MGGEKGAGNQVHVFWRRRKQRSIWERGWMQTPLGSCGLPAHPVSSLSALHTHTAELPGAARAVRKTGRRTGGLWAGSREHGSSWATQRGPRQERPLCRGRAAAGTAAPLVLHIPGGNGIFGGRRAPGRNSRAAFGARPWLSCWDPELQQWCWGVGDCWGGCSLWAREGITVTCKCAKLQAGCWEQSRRIL